MRSGLDALAEGLRLSRKVRRRHSVTYVFYYETSPSQAQLIDYYHRALVGMMNGGFFRR